MSRKAKLTGMANPWGWIANAEDEEIPLLEATLLVAQDEYPDLDVAAYLAKVDLLAAKLTDLGAEEGEPVARLRTLNQFLFDDQGYSGNFLDFYDPRNSYLCDVLDRKTGIPISLAVLYVELGRGLGVDLEGVSFPGHFLVRLPVDGGLIVLDPFHRGKSVGSEELRQRARSGSPADDPDDAQLFALLSPATHRATLARMLQNLKSLYVERADLARALRVSNRLVQLTGTLTERRDRGLLYLQLGSSSAKVDLQHYLLHAADAPDVAEVREALLASQKLPRMS